MTVSEYIKQLQGYEEYAFSWEELRAYSNSPESTLRKELTRLVVKQDITPLRQGFYLIIPPRYQKVGKIPVAFYADKLFRFLKRPYYVALYSAASSYGASHQQIQQDYIMTSHPTPRDINRQNTIIRFFGLSGWPEKNIVQRKSDAGLYKISSPALTAIDLIHHQTKIGGMNRAITILEELTEEITETDIRELLTWYPHTSSLQRFGYLLEELNAPETHTSLVHQFLSKQNFYPVLLSPNSQQKAGGTGNRWKVDVNLELESDL